MNLNIAEQKTVVHIVLPEVFHVFSAKLSVYEVALQIVLCCLLKGENNLFGNIIVPFVIFFMYYNVAFI